MALPDTPPLGRTSDPPDPFPRSHHQQQVLREVLLQGSRRLPRPRRGTHRRSASPCRGIEICVQSPRRFSRLAHAGKPARRTHHDARASPASADDQLDPIVDSSPLPNPVFDRAGRGCREACREARREEARAHRPSPRLQGAILSPKRAISHSGATVRDPRVVPHAVTHRCHARLPDRATRRRSGASSPARIGSRAASRPAVPAKGNRTVARGRFPAPTTVRRPGILGGHVVRGGDRARESGAASRRRMDVFYLWLLRASLTRARFSFRRHR